MHYFHYTSTLCFIHLLISTLSLSASLPAPLLPPREHVPNYAPRFFTFSDQHLQQSNAHAQKEINLRKTDEQKIKQKLKQTASDIKKISKKKLPERLKQQQEYKENLEENYQYNLLRIRHLISHRQNILRHFEQQEKQQKKTNQNIAILRAQQTSQQVAFCPPSIFLQQIIAAAKLIPLPSKKIGNRDDLPSYNSSPHNSPHLLSPNQDDQEEEKEEAIQQQEKNDLLLSRLLVEQSLYDSGVNSRLLRSPHPSRSSSSSSYSSNSSKPTSAHKYATFFRQFY